MSIFLGRIAVALTQLLVISVSGQILPCRRLSTFGTQPSVETWNKPPIVDRTALARIFGIENMMENDDRRTSPTWPPFVTRIPEPQEQGILRTLAPQILHSNRSLCSSKPCQFILPLKIGEQESKARLHLLQIFQLARVLNRILVLPRVDKSRLGACGSMDFSRYYDFESLAAAAGESGLCVIEMDTFEQWMNTPSRSWHPSSQLVSISPRREGGFLSHNSTIISSHDIQLEIVHDPSDADLGITSCLPTKSPGLVLDSHFPVSIYPFEHGLQILRDGTIGPLIASALSQRHIHEASLRTPTSEPTPDIFFLNWNLRHPAFPASSPSLALEYSAHLQKLATTLAPPSPYIAVHWRMETVPPANLPQCAYSLLDTLSHLLRDPSIGTNIRSVWFASDYPQGTSFHEPRTREKSGTFGVLTPHHHSAVDILRSAFDFGGLLDQWALAGLPKVVSEDAIMGDNGVQGILDKVIATRAEVFVSGGNGCGRIR